MTEEPGTGVTAMRSDAELDRLVAAADPTGGRPRDAELTVGDVFADPALRLIMGQARNRQESGSGRMYGRGGWGSRPRLAFVVCMFVLLLAGTVAVASQGGSDAGNSVDPVSDSQTSVVRSVPEREPTSTASTTLAPKTALNSTTVLIPTTALNSTTALASTTSARATATTTTTPTTPITDRPTSISEPSLPPSSEVAAEECQGRGPSLMKARAAYEAACTEPRRDCDVDGVEWVCSNKVLWFRTATTGP